MDKVISDNGSSKGKPSGGKNSQGINLVDKVKAAHARRAAANSEGGTKGENSTPKEPDSTPKEPEENNKVGTSKENNKVGTPETTDSEDTTKTPRSGKLKKLKDFKYTLGDGKYRGSYKPAPGGFDLEDYVAGKREERAQKKDEEQRKYDSILKDDPITDNKKGSSKENVQDTGSQKSSTSAPSGRQKLSTRAQATNTVNNTDEPNSENDNISNDPGNSSTSSDLDTIKKRNLARMQEMEKKAKQKKKNEKREREKAENADRGLRSLQLTKKESKANYDRLSTAGKEHVNFLQKRYAELTEKSKDTFASRKSKAELAKDMKNIHSTLINKYGVLP